MSSTQETQPVVVAAVAVEKPKEGAQSDAEAAPKAKRGGGRKPKSDAEKPKAKKVETKPVEAAAVVAEAKPVEEAKAAKKTKAKAKSPKTGDVVSAPVEKKVDSNDEKKKKRKAPKPEDGDSAVKPATEAKEKTKKGKKAKAPAVDAAGNPVPQKKRKLTPFIVFCQKVRPIVLSENPTLKFGEIGVLMGKKWGVLSADEKKQYAPMEDAVPVGGDAPAPPSATPSNPQVVEAVPSAVAPSPLPSSTQAQ